MNIEVRNLAGRVLGSYDIDDHTPQEMRDGTAFAMMCAEAGYTPREAEAKRFAFFERCTFHEVTSEEPTPVHPMLIDHVLPASAPGLVFKGP